MKNVLKKILWLLAQIGIHPLVFIKSVRGLPFFMKDWIHFRKSYSGRMNFTPCLHDRFEEGGVTKNEYFWQDLLVAQWIHSNNPRKHLDVGSRIDGFVAHVASFRDVEVIDIRPVSTQIPGVSFYKGDLMKGLPLLQNKKEGGYCDSLSCLHTIEHFGLGRYGDDLDVLGYQKGIENLATLLEVGGIFYLSTPIGKERVEFNANRVFDPRTIIEVAKKNKLSLESLITIENNQPHNVLIDEEILGALAEKKYSLGIFTFKRL
ncbi:MAG: hypothetical protein CMK41_06670 [Porticoccaceae bacterium]|nr:hypothetical protein [Porticoccaceae bacterium]|tara:strand:+ start:1684 stop:2469 length:786 start_codon:yes stop_codon:yes gene_type:complete